MGRVIVACLRRHDPRLRITIADRVAPTRNAGRQRPRFRQVDLRDHAALIRVLRGHAVVINSTSHHFNLPVMRAALAAGVHYLDLGGLFHYTRRQFKLDAEFRVRGLTAVLGMGCAPGISNLLARWGAAGMERVDEIHIKVGSRAFPSRIERRASSVEPSAFPYAIGTIREELTWKPALYRKGRWFFGKPRSGVERFQFPAPVGTQRIFLTIHSELATLPLSFPGLKEASFRIGFPDEMIRAAIGSKPVERRASSVERAEGAPPRDCEVTLALVRGRSGRKRVARQATCAVWSSGVRSAGDWDTAWPPAIVAAMIARGEISRRGVFAPENIVPLDSFLEKLKRAGFSLARTGQGKTGRK